MHNKSLKIVLAVTASSFYYFCNTTNDPYVDQLLTLEPQALEQPFSLPATLQLIVTPLHYEVWQFYLADHYD